MHFLILFSIKNTIFAPKQSNDGMNMKKVLFIIGSLRAKSFNRQMAEVAKEIIGNQAEVQELGISSDAYSSFSIFSTTSKSAGNQSTLSSCSLVNHRAASCSLRCKASFSKLQ